MGFYNKVRLPFHLSRPQYPVDENLYRQSDGHRRITKSIVSKEYQGVTDWIPEKWHERLVIALRHDNVQIFADNGKRFEGVRINGAYEIDWPENNYPLAMARFKAFDESFNASSSSCSTCDDVEQMTLNDDTIPDELIEGQDAQINVATNDKICCVGPVFAIVSKHPSIGDISIDANGLVNFVVLQPVASAGNVVLFTYSVDCGDGNIQTADVYGSINGSLSESCPMIANLAVEADEDDPIQYAVHATWDPNVPAPGSGYNWYLYKVVSGSEILVSDGNTADTFLDINALDFDSLYRLYVGALCAPGNESNLAMVNILTPLDNPHPNLNINLSIIKTNQMPDGSGDLRVQAIQTNGIIVNEAIQISGDIEVFEPGNYHLLPFNIILNPGEGFKQTANLEHVTGSYSVVFHDVFFVPPAVTEFGSGDTYNVHVNY